MINKSVALSVIALAQSTPKTNTLQIIAKQGMASEMYLIGMDNHMVVNYHQFELIVQSFNVLHRIFYRIIVTLQNNVSVNFDWTIRTLTNL